MNSNSLEAENFLCLFLSYRYKFLFFIHEKIYFLQLFSFVFFFHSIFWIIYRMEKVKSSCDREKISSLSIYFSVTHSTKFIAGFFPHKYFWFIARRQEKIPLLSDLHFMSSAVVIRFSHPDERKNIKIHENADSLSHDGINFAGKRKEEMARAARIHFNVLQVRDN